jgi:hypothetical protein
MIPGFLSIPESPQTGSSGPNDAVLALAGPWDFDNGGGRHTKICGDAYSKTSCQGLVLFCRNCRMCRWSDGYAYFEDCAFWYPCGVCVGADW